jgi:hypothetical protein
MDSCLSKRLLYLRRYMFLDLLTTVLKFIFSSKNYLFVTLKSDQDPDPDPHWFASWIWIRIEIKSWIRIRIKPMRIHNNGRMTVVWLYVRYFNWKDISDFVLNNIIAQECSEGTPPAVSILVSLPIHVVEQVLEFQVIRPIQNRSVYSIIGVFQSVFALTSFRSYPEKPKKDGFSLCRSVVFTWSLWGFCLFGYKIKISLVTVK